eukprot:UN05514
MAQVESQLLLEIQSYKKSQNKFNTYYIQYPTNTDNIYSKIFR